MRLIHTTRLELQEFFDAHIPEYATLSHCWGKDEVTYQQFMAGEGRDTEGWRKIVFCCKAAKSISNLEWAWVDTCCIDKSSTAELSESINSMYEWYRQATRCFVMLPETLQDDEQEGCRRKAETHSDVGEGSETASPTSDELQAVRNCQISHVRRSNENSGTISHLGQSRWFARGWTLQELLASPSAVFFDRDITLLGTAFDLRQQLAEITGIGIEYLTGVRNVHQASVACRMSWASKRQTTRGEDIAYCLLGIFDINMPLLYGEGSKGAFRRLQEAIIVQSDDQTIFAWTREMGPNSRSSVLAQSPSDFAECAFLVPSQHEAPPSQITSRGVQIYMTYERLRDFFGAHPMTTPSMRSYLPAMYLTLACYDSRWPIKHEGHHDSVQIKLKRDEGVLAGVEQYYRVETNRMLRSRVPFLVEELRRWTNLVIAPRFWSIYAQRLDRARDDRPQAYRTQGDPYQQTYTSLPGIVTAAWLSGLVFAIVATVKLGHWLGQINHGTLLTWAIVAVALYYQRSQLAHALFLSNSGYVPDKRAWSVFLVSLLPVLDFANPSWTSRLLPVSDLPSWALCVLIALVAAWSATHPTRLARIPPILVMVIILIVTKVMGTLGKRLVSPLSTNQARGLNIVLIAIFAVSWYSIRGQWKTSASSNAKQVLRRT